MKRIPMAGVGALALTILPLPASAADMPTKVPVKAPVVAPLFDWTGFYAGIHGGYGWGRAEWRYLNDSWWNNDPGDIFRHRPDGWLAGGHIGANRQIGPWVYGLEGSLAWTGMEKDSVSPLFSQDHFRTRLTWLGTLTGKIGHTWDRTLLYAKAGFAGGRIKLRAYDFNNPPNIDTSSKFHYGWTVGVGAETALPSNWVLGVEYNYVDLRSKRHVGDMTGGAPVNYIVKPDLQIHTVVARISYLFGTR